MEGQYEKSSFTIERGTIMASYADVKCTCLPLVSRRRTFKLCGHVFDALPPLYITRVDV